MARRKKPKGRYHHGDLDSALIEQAIALTDKHGIDGWSLSQAARQLGVSSAAPYRHFANRGELLDAVAQHGLIVLRDVIRVAHEAHRSARRQYHAVSLATVSLALDKPALYAITFSGARPNTLGQLSKAGPETAFGTLKAMIIGWQEAGLFCRGDPIAIAIAMWAAAHGLASLLASGRVAVPRRQARSLCSQTMDALLDGLAPR